MIAVGIDVSKSKSTVAILNADGTQLVRPFNMAHTLPEMNSFVERLTSLIAVVSSAKYRFDCLIIPYKQISA